MKKRLEAMLLALVTAVSLLSLPACSGGKKTIAATMHLRRAEGSVSVSDGSGKMLLPLKNLGLYSGYGVGTGSASYAWIDLDDVKLTKLDQNSKIVIEKEGKKLDVRLMSGSLFFNITKPLEDGETLNIRTSTMLIGIRGTSGWVEERDGFSRVYILEGKVECSAEGKTVQVGAGETAVLTQDGELTVTAFTTPDIPDFVMDETETDEKPTDDPPEGSGSPAGNAVAGYRIEHTDLETDAPLECFFERPVFDEITPGYAAINAFFEGLETGFFNSPDVAYIEEAASDPNAMYTPYSYTYGAGVTAQGSSYVSVFLSRFWYSGGARPDGGGEHYTFSTETGEQLGIQDFIDAADEEILDMIKTELRTFDDGMNFIWFDYFSGWPLSKYDFYITDGAVHVFFEPGTVAMVAAGVIDITLPAPLELD